MMGENGPKLCQTRDSLPDLVFNINGHGFALEPSDYIWDDYEGDCYSALMPDDSRVDSPPRIVLGAPFITKWMPVFDIEKRTISLGKAKPKH